GIRVPPLTLGALLEGAVRAQNAFDLEVRLVHRILDDSPKSPSSRQKQPFHTMVNSNSNINPQGLPIDGTVNAKFLDVLFHFLETISSVQSHRTALLHPSGHLHGRPTLPTLALLPRFRFGISTSLPVIRLPTHRLLHQRLFRVRFLDAIVQDSTWCQNLYEAVGGELGASTVLERFQSRFLAQAFQLKGDPEQE
ncbi:hypothetical protein HK102_007184, partial [Quaeritorhiza haematococci]